MQQRSDNIKIIGVPFRSGANREGAQYAPKWLMKHLSMSIDDLFFLSTDDKPLTDDAVAGVRNYEAVLQMRERVKSYVAKAIENGKKVLTIGGDHSIAMGSIAGVLEQYPNVGVIWFDAHTDINTEATSPSGNAHGMPLAALMGLCASEINTRRVKLIPKNVYWVGARDIDTGESETIRQLCIANHVFTTQKVHEIGMQNVMNQIRNAFTADGINLVHLSFDVDGMDPLYVPATGTPVEAGLNERDLKVFIENMTKMPKLISMDFVEYNPLLDDGNYATGNWCTETIKKLYTIL